MVKIASISDSDSGRKPSSRDAIATSISAGLKSVAITCCRVVIAKNGSFRREKYPKEEVPNEWSQSFLACFFDKQGPWVNLLDLSSVCEATAC